MLTSAKEPRVEIEAKVWVEDHADQESYVKSYAKSHKQKVKFISQKTQAKR